MNPADDCPGSKVVADIRELLANTFKDKAMMRQLIGILAAVWYGLEGGDHLDKSVVVVARTNAGIMIGADFGDGEKLDISYFSDDIEADNGRVIASRSGLRALLAAQDKAPRE